MQALDEDEPKAQSEKSVAPTNTATVDEAIYRIGKNYTLDAEHATLKYASGSSRTLTVREAALLADAL